MKVSLSVFVSLLSCSLAFAQSGDSLDAETSAGEVYSQVVGQACDATGCDSDAGCRTAQDDWNHSFFDCCKKSRFDYDVCDPCCKKPYVSVFGGATTVENFYRDLVTATVPLTIEEQGANLVDGYGFGTAIGYRVHPLFRLEAEYSYRFNRVENWFTTVRANGLITSATVAAASGRVSSHAGMFNALYDLSPRRVRCFNLYGGGGIGVLTIDAAVSTGANNYVSDDSQFAWQFIGGVNYPLSNRIEMFTEYRYLGSQKLDLVDAATLTNFGDVDYDSHNMFFGFRFNR